MNEFSTHNNLGQNMRWVLGLMLCDRIYEPKSPTELMLLKLCDMAGYVNKMPSGYLITTQGMHFGWIAKEG